jgi:hypothetical protein
VTICTIIALLCTVILIKILLIRVLPRSLVYSKMNHVLIRRDGKIVGRRNKLINVNYEYFLSSEEETNFHSGSQI